MPMPDTAHDTVDSRTHRRRRLPVLASAVIVLGLVGWAAFATTRSHAAPPSSIAVVKKASTGGDLNNTTNRAAFQFEVRNVGPTVVTIVRAGRSGPGLQLRRTLVHRVANPWVAQSDGGHLLPISVARHQVVSLSLVYHVTACHGLDGRTWPIPVTYRSGSRVRTVMLDPGGSPGLPTWHAVLTPRGMCAH